MEKLEEQLKVEAVKELTRSLHVISGVHEKLADERENITSVVAQMSFISKEFETCSKKITEKIINLDSMTQAIISREMQKISKDITEEVGRNIIDTITSKAEESIKRLIAANNNCERKLHDSSRSVRRFSRWFLLSTFLLTLIAGFSGGYLVHYLFPKMDQQVLDQIKSGETMKVIWSKLDRKEKEKLTSIYFENPAKTKNKL